MKRTTIARKLRWWPFGLLLGLMFTTTSQAEVVIIGNKALPIESISKIKAADIWQGKDKALRGIMLTPLDQANDTAEYKKFYRIVVAKSARQMDVYWGKQTFSGKNFPPKKLDGDAEVIAEVKKNVNAVGYVDEASVDDSVKVLAVVKIGKF